MNSPLPTITGNVRLQAWSGDTCVPLSDHDFDATRAIVELPLGRVKALKDADYSTDEVVKASECPEYDEHAGPFDVSVCESIETALEHFGVESIAKLDQSAWSSIQQTYRERWAAKE